MFGKPDVKDEILINMVALLLLSVLAVSCVMWHQLGVTLDSGLWSLWNC